MNAPVNLPGRFDALPRFATALKAIEALKPGEPLYLVHPEQVSHRRRLRLCRDQLFRQKQ